MLFKLRLTLLVIISAVLSYYMGTDQTNVTTLSALCIGGLLLTGGSNGLNQALEREWDKLMLRTQNRPIPTGRMSLRTAVVLSMTAGILGILILWYYCGTACGILGASAFILYVAFYTPMKRVSSLAVFIGAFPGAIPPMLGYVAATQDFGLEAGLLFAMQFMWQFPHFWAIAWVAHDDYVRGGYKLLPFNEGRSKASVHRAQPRTVTERSRGRSPSAAEVQSRGKRPVPERSRGPFLATRDWGLGTGISCKYSLVSNH